MNETPEGNAQGNGADSAKLNAQAPIVVHAQYLKDISFENPHAPDSLRAGQPGPQMDININMDARKFAPEEGQDAMYEVVLALTATAKRDGATVFLAEVQYGAVASLPGVPEETHHPILLIEVPRTLFPFARQLLAELTQSGGYPPLLLNPIDFRALYMEQFVKDEDKQAAAE